MILTRTTPAVRVVVERRSSDYRIVGITARGTHTAAVFVPFFATSAVFGKRVHDQLLRAYRLDDEEERDHGRRISGAGAKQGNAGH